MTCGARATQKCFATHPKRKDRRVGGKGTGGNLRWTRCESTDGRGWGQALTREPTTKLPGSRGPGCSSAEREGESFLISNLPRGLAIRRLFCRVCCAAWAERVVGN